MVVYCMIQLIYTLLDILAICALIILIINKFTVINDIVVYSAYIILFIYIIIKLVEHFQRL